MYPAPPVTRIVFGCGKLDCKGKTAISACSSGRFRGYWTPGSACPNMRIEGTHVSGTGDAPIVTFQREADIAVVTLNRPHRRNALSLELMAALIRTIAAMRGKPEMHARH